MEPQTIKIILSVALVSIVSVSIILVSIILVVFAIVALPWIMIAIGSIFAPNPPAPEITYGEFPFRLEYEINGERVVVEDTVVCEYGGVGWDEGQGKHRTWEGYLASSGEENVLVVTDGTRKIYCYVGSAEYYMGDEKYPEKRPLIPRLYMDDPNLLISEIAIQDEIIAGYNIELISWEFTDPITNSFISK